MYMYMHTKVATRADFAGVIKLIIRMCIERGKEEHFMYCVPIIITIVTVFLPSGADRRTVDTKVIPCIEKDLLHQSCSHSGSAIHSAHQTVYIYIHEPEYMHVHVYVFSNSNYITPYFPHPITKMDPAS